MMGRQVEQGALFYEFRLEGRVPADHLLRRVDAILDLGFVHEVMAEHYSAIGRPSVDPVLMVRMLLVGYLYGVRSERRLCDEVDLNLAYRWFCRLGLDGRVPDHSTFTKNRHGRFRDSKVMRVVFERVVEHCLDLGLANMAHVAVDGSHMTADASKERFVGRADELPRENATRPVREYFDDLDRALPDLEGTKRAVPKAISTTDPSAALSTKHGRRVFAYRMNAMIDTGSGIVLDVEAAPARTADEPEAARRIVERVRERHGTSPSVLAADTAYGSSHFLAWAERQGIETHVPVIDSRSGSGRRPPKEAFSYDAASDTYRCPNGKTLRRAGSKRGTGSQSAKGRYGGVFYYYPSRRDCGACPIQPDCAPSGLRAVHRTVHEEARERAKAREGTAAFRTSTMLRRRVERLFALVKHNDGFQRVRLRGLKGAAEQFILAATARNLKRMVRLLPSSPAPAV